VRVTAPSLSRVAATFLIDMCCFEMFDDGETDPRPWSLFVSRPGNGCEAGFVRVGICAGPIPTFRALRVVGGRRDSDLPSAPGD